MNTDNRDRLHAQQIALAKALTSYHVQQTGKQEPALVGLDAEEIARSAETLIRKRSAQTRSALPGTASILSDKFSAEFRIFALTHFFNGPDALWREAIEFTTWLDRRHIHPLWLHDTLTWERKRCLWQSRRQYCSLFRLRYRIVAWLEGDRESEPQQRNQWFFVWRLGTRGKIVAYPSREQSAQ